MTFPDVEQLDQEHLVEILKVIRDGCETVFGEKEGIVKQSKFMEAVIDDVAYYTGKEDHLPSIQDTAADTFVQYFADREYIMQWKEDMEIDYRLRWDTDKTPEEIAAEVSDDETGDAE